MASTKSTICRRCNGTGSLSAAINYCPTCDGTGDTTRGATQKQARVAASEARMAAARAEASTALAANVCPTCGQGVKRNLALTGWVQCAGFGAEGFRAPGATSCNWQGFA